MTGGKKRLIKYGGLAGIIIFLAVLSFAVIRPAWAQEGSILGQAGAGAISGMGDVVRIILGSILSLYVFVIGNLLIVLISILVKVASYNDFVNSVVVLNGWTIIRDISNMFFILILLAIAFGTILGVDRLDWKARLPKLLIFAVLINFTRVIAGVVIDFGQVLMITFVNGFKDAAGGNFAELLGIKQLLEINVVQQASNIQQGNVVEAGIDFVQIIGAMIAAAIFVTISLIVILLLVLVLIYRIVMLWIYVTVSPIAFLLGAFPQGEKYYNKWWDQLVSAVALGPVLAFFLWLSLLSVSQISLATRSPTSANDTIFTTTTSISCGPTEACQADNILKFIVGIGLLMGGLGIAQQFAGSAGEGFSGLISTAKRASVGMAKRMTGIAAGQRFYKAYEEERKKSSKGVMANAGQIAGFGGNLLKSKLPNLLAGKSKEAIGKFQSEKIGDARKFIEDKRNDELISIVKQAKGPSYQAASAYQLLAERGAIKEGTAEDKFSKREIAAASGVFANNESDYKKFKDAVKKSAPALVYDLENPAEVKQFAIDASRGVARLDNLEAEYFTDKKGEKKGEGKGAKLVKNITADKTPDEIADIYRKLRIDAKVKFKEQMLNIIEEGNPSEDMRQAYADITLEIDKAFPGMYLKDETGEDLIDKKTKKKYVDETFKYEKELQRWVDRHQSAMISNKGQRLEEAGKIFEVLKESEERKKPKYGLDDTQPIPNGGAPAESGPQVAGKVKLEDGPLSTPGAAQSASATSSKPMPKPTAKEMAFRASVTLPIDTTTGYSPKMPTEEKLAEEARAQQREENKKQYAQEVYQDYKSQPPEHLDEGIQNLKDLLEKQIKTEVEGSSLNHSLLGTQRRLEALESAKKKIDLEKLRDEKKKAYVASELGADKSRLQKEIDELESKLAAEEPKPKG